MRKRQVFFSAFVVAFLSACSTAQTTVDRYQNLDYDSKSVFLAYYPYLSRDQKNDLLSSADQNPREMIESWAGQLNDPAHEVGAFDEMMKNPDDRKPTALELTLDMAEPIVAGTRIPVHAFALWKRRKRVEVTSDITWRIDSRLAHMDGNELVLGCANSDISVVADFLGEHETSRGIRIRKPLNSLEMRVSEAYLGADSGYNFQLNLVAHCQDGTVSDVSCQADWKSFNTSAEVGGCGSFTISPKETMAEGALSVSARYGNLSVRKTLYPPIR